jgi:chromosome segregation ATPase
MPGISISELISYNCTDGLNESLIPISVNGNTYSIKSSVFLNDLNNCINSTLNCVQQQGNTISTCLVDTSTLSNSIQCNETEITNIKQCVTNISSQLTEIEGRVNLTSTLADSCCLSQRIENNLNCIDNNALQITTLNGCIDTINQELLIKAGVTQVNNLANCLNSADTSIENLRTCVLSLSGQIGVIDVNSTAQEFDSLSSSIQQSLNDINNLCSTVTTLDGCISTLNNNLNAKANTSIVTTLQSDVNTAEGNISSLQTCTTKFDNCITCIENDLTAKANASAVNTITSALNTANGNITSLQTCTTNLQNSINNLDIGSQASAISQLQTDVNTAENNITQSQTCITNLDTCVNSLNNTINATSSNVSTLQSTVNGFSSSISTACTLATNASNDVTSLNSKYGIRVNANGAVAGFGILACANDSGQCKTAFTIQSNCFALEDQAGSDCIQPFVVENNCVRMCGAYIKDLSVDTLQIGEQAISSCSLTEGQDRTFSIAANTNLTCREPLGGWEDIASSTIVSAGCPTIVNFGFKGDLFKRCTNKIIKHTTSITGGIVSYNRNGTSSSVTGSQIVNVSKDGCTWYYFDQFSCCYGVTTRVVRTHNNSTCIIDTSNNNQFLDSNPPTGAVSYKLQGKFIRDFCTIPATLYIRSRKNAGGFTGIVSSISEQGTTTLSVDSLLDGSFYKDFTSSFYSTSVRPTVCFVAGDFQTNYTQTIQLVNPFIEIRQNKR